MLLAMLAIACTGFEVPGATLVRWEEGGSGWYLPPRGDPSGAGVVMVHSVHPKMLVTRPLAEGLSRRGVAVLIVELPGFGSKADADPHGTGVSAVLDPGRAAADAVAARAVLLDQMGVPEADRDRARVGVMGVSLGTFAALAAGIDEPRYDPVLLVLGGGPAREVLLEGQRDAAFLRSRVLATGISPAELAERLDRTDPWHRVAGAPGLAERVWAAYALKDRVFPNGTPVRLTEHIGVPEAQRMPLNANHYTAALAWPAVLDWAERAIKASVDAGAATRPPDAAGPATR